MNLRTRLLLSHVIVGMAGLLVLFVALWLLLSQVQIRQRQRQLGQVALAAVRSVPKNLQTDEALPKLRERLARFGKDEGVRVLLLNAQGEVIEDINNPGEGAMISTTMRGKVLSLTTSITVNGVLRGVVAVGDFRDRAQRWLFAAVETRPNATAAEWFVLAEPGANRFALTTLDDLGTPLIQGSLVALVVSLLASVFVARSIAAPIQKVTEAANAMAHGKYDQRVPVFGPREVQELAQDFNNMASRVQAAQQAERDFVANVSHELKTPLTSIQGFAQAIEDQAVSEPQDVQRAARVVREEAERLRRLTNGLLDSAQIQSGTIQMAHAPLDLNEIAQACVERLQLRAQSAGISLITRLAALPEVQGDGDRIAQVITNLLDNALKHTPSGSKVTLETQVSKRGVEVSVLDTGAGIPPEDVPRIFERFYQVDKSRSSGAAGSGLGLAICKQIVDAHGGQLSVQSALGVGTRVTFALPLPA
jgi:signal transduction histidine kinase